jgi:hypothetical protein
MLVPSETKKRQYERVEPKAFLDEVKGLIEGKPASDAKSRKAQAATSGSTKPKKDAYFTPCRSRFHGMPVGRFT